MNSLLIRKKLIEKQMFIFSLQEFERAVGIYGFNARYILEKETGELFVRLKNGLYALKTDMPGEGVIANRLYRPSYVSLEYALAYHSIIPEMVYSVTSVTTKPTRNFGVEGKAFSYFRIKLNAYTGYFLVNRETDSFYLAEPEKALVDYLYFVSLGKKTLNDRLDLSSLDKGKLIEYAKLFEREGLTKLVKELI